jgi:hypothetical protein
MWPQAPMKVLTMKVLSELAAHFGDTVSAERVGTDISPNLASTEVVARYRRRSDGAGEESSVPTVFVSGRRSR